MIREIEEKRPELAELCRRFHVKRLEVFGSAATGEFRAESSDLDLIVEFEALRPEEHGEAYFGLLSSLEDLFGRPVDLLEAPAIWNPYFLAAIEPLRVELYAA